MYLIKTIRHIDKNCNKKVRTYTAFFFNSAYKILATICTKGTYNICRLNIFFATKKSPATINCRGLILLVPRINNLHFHVTISIIKTKERNPQSSLSLSQTDSFQTCMNVMLCNNNSQPTVFISLCSRIVII